eukprot:342211-Hanusia_phi.AAC.1
MPVGPGVPSDGTRPAAEVPKFKVHRVPLRPHCTAAALHAASRRAMPPAGRSPYGTTDRIRSDRTESPPRGSPGHPGAAAARSSRCQRLRSLSRDSS